MSHQPEPTQPARTPAQTRAVYTAPRVQDLGAWQAVTLIQSVPIGPGAFLPGTGGAHE